MALSISSSCEKLYKVIKFLLNNWGKVFDDVPETDAQPGDVLLFPTEDSGSLFKHAAVYLGNGEVIQFQGVAGEGNTGQVIKEGFQDMEKATGKCQVYRKRGEIDLDDLHSKVKEAVNREGNFEQLFNNCIQFALWLLGLKDIYKQLVEIKNEDGKKQAISSSCERQFQAIQFLLLKTIPGRDVVFDNVPESEMQPGDILLVPIQSDNPIHCLFKHAAVYLGKGEVIHFQGLADESNTGLVSKEGFRAMRRQRGECQVYRKRGGINRRELKRRVTQAMNSKSQYHPGTNNCIHFALWLLGLSDFYMTLVEIPD
ncbi:uncharacterized protein LOC135182766 [Pogoniulus pusillus]|uniref:uncharacterized protein LOC135182766 n=1 Tax=Pogoniulus pusillus TaxID=488313 RepID=UPI0030B96E43